MDANENKQIMAKNIRKYMERKGISNQKLCDDLGFKYTTFMDWIKAVTYPRIGRVEAMAQYFGCEKSDLIEDKKESPVTDNDDGLAEVIKMFSELSPDNRAKLLELGRLFLDAQRKSE